MAAKVYSPPKELGPVPEISIDNFADYFAAEEAWVDKLKAWAKTHGDGSPESGEEISFPMGDGRARYVVYKIKPLTFIHVPTGDAWNWPQIHLMTARETKKMVSQGKALAALFRKPAAKIIVDRKIKAALH